jgi:hypothetical protein
MHRFTRIAGALALVLAVPLAATVMAAQPFEDPILGSAHGSTYGPGGTQIDITAQFIARAQQIYLSHVLDSASAAQRAAYESKRTYLDAVALGATGPADKQSALVARSLLLDWLIGEVQPTDAKLLKQRNGMLKSWLQQGLGYTVGTPYRMQPHEQAMLSQVGLAAPALVAAGAPPSDEVLQAREAYAKKCRKAGVPLPPTWDWGAAAGGWKSNGKLSTIFISNDKEAEVFVHQSTSPQGVCLALPRYLAVPADAPAVLLGIICMGTGVDAGGGNVVSSACFWDNQKDGNSVDIPRSGEFPVNTNFAAGPELDGGEGGTCTACHAGENAYVVHPDDKAFQGIANLEPKAYYKPIVAASWPQNSGPNTKLAGVVLPAGQESCLDCHSAGDQRRLPEIVKGLATPPGQNYCDAVLKNAIKKTMPQGGTVFPDPDYKTHTDFLIKACADAAGP